MRRTMAALSAALCAGFVLNAVRLGHRLAGIGTLEPAAQPPSGRFRFLLADGVRLSEESRQAACAFAYREGLKVVDLIPGDLPSEELLDFARGVDTRCFRHRRLAFGRSTYHAMVVAADVLERLGRSLPAGEDLTGLPPEDFAELAVRLKKCAPTTTGFAWVPGLHGRSRTARERVITQRENAAAPLPAVLATRLALATFTTAALAITPAWGMSALIGYWLQPWLVHGRRFAPADRHRATLLRPVLGPFRWLRTAQAAYALRGPADPHAELRCAYEAETAQGVARFLEPRRGTCTWCGSPDLRKRVTTWDMYQGKPGRFTLEECGRCGHTFQNPRLTPAGLDFYYRDCYDGIGERRMERVFALQERSYQARAEFLRPHATPRRWLDVGAGHGHFCLIAQSLWPQTTFHGLDRGSAVTQAERHGWVHKSYRGGFPEQAEKLAGTYDVVSMSHYLEHTLDPRAELQAAYTVLQPGGHVMIEVPDPQSPLSRLLGRHWMSWMQPQHLHLVPFANLQAALGELGFTMVAEQRVTSRPGWDFCGALLDCVRSRTPSPRHPWSGTRPTRLRALGHGVIWACSIPLFAVAAAVDLAMAPFLGMLRCGHTYRVLGRKDG